MQWTLCPLHFFFILVCYIWCLCGFCFKLLHKRFSASLSLFFCNNKRWVNKKRSAKIALFPRLQMSITLKIILKAIFIIDESRASIHFALQPLFFNRTRIKFVHRIVTNNVAKIQCLFGLCNTYLWVIS